MEQDSGSFIERILELGIGMTMIRQMPDMLGNMVPPVSQPGSISVPPPIQEEKKTYLAVDNTQAGPFSDAELQKLIDNSLLTQETLVWKAGMSTWLPASQVPDVNKLFLLSKIK